MKFVLHAFIVWCTFLSKSVQTQIPKHRIQFWDKEIIQLELSETNGKITRDIIQTNANRSFAMANIDRLELPNEQMHFFAQPNFQDFLLASKVTTTCSNILGKNDVQSIKISGCVMFYSDHNCLGRSIRIESPGAMELRKNWESTLTSARTLYLLYTSFPSLNWATKSFHSCRTHKENEELNVDITESLIRSCRFCEPKFLETYQNVCSCNNVPKDVRDLESWSINNYDNSIMAYFEQDCTSLTYKPLWIPAGHSSFSMALGVFYHQSEVTNTKHKILSFGPDLDSQYFRKNCVKLYSIITMFEIVGQNYTEENEEMAAARTTFINDGLGAISQTFTASKTIRNSFTVDIGTSLNKMERVELDNSFEIGTKTSTSQSEKDSLKLSVSAGVSASANVFGVGVSGSISGEVKSEHSNSSSKSQEDGFKEGLRQAYENKIVIGISKKSVKTVENTKSLTVSEEITVPECYEKDVHAYVKTVKNMQIEFRALAKISGKFQTRDMTALEVRKFMDDQLEFAGNWDETTVLAYSTGTFKADYGVESFIRAHGKRIAGCLERNELPHCKPVSLDCIACKACKPHTKKLTPLPSPVNPITTGF